MNDGHCRCVKSQNTTFSIKFLPNGSQSLAVNEKCECQGDYIQSEKLNFVKNDPIDKYFTVRDDENYSHFISRMRGIALSWVIAFPLAVVLYENFPNASITVRALAVVATVLVIFVFPGRPTCVNETTFTQEIELPRTKYLSSEIFACSSYTSIVSSGIS